MTSVVIHVLFRFYALKQRALLHVYPRLSTFWTSPIGPIGERVNYEFIVGTDASLENRKELEMILFPLLTVLSHFSSFSRAFPRTSWAFLQPRIVVRYTTCLESSTLRKTLPPLHYWPVRFSELEHHRLSFFFGTVPSIYTYILDDCTIYFILF